MNARGASISAPANWHESLVARRRVYEQNTRTYKYMDAFECDRTNGMLSPRPLGTNGKLSNIYSALLEILPFSNNKYRMVTVIYFIRSIILLSSRFVPRFCATKSCFLPLQVYLCVPCSSCTDLVHHAESTEEHCLYWYMCGIASEHPFLRQVCSIPFALLFIGFLANGPMPCHCVFSSTVLLLLWVWCGRFSHMWCVRVHVCVQCMHVRH